MMRALVVWTHVCRRVSSTWSFTSSFSNSLRFILLDAAFAPATSCFCCLCDRSGVFPCTLGLGGPQTRGGAGTGARPSHSGWFAVSAGGAAVCQLLVQACAGAGH